MPVDDEGSLPAVMKEALGYPFYEYDEQQVPLELDPAYGEEFTRKYNLKLAKLAYDIAGLIKKIESAPAVASKPAEAPAAVTSKPAIYLAECSFDRRSAREALESELKLHGYPVFPDIQLPKLEDEYIAAVDGFLARSQLSIHLVGTKYGVVPDGPSEKSVTILQNELAIEAHKNRGLRRIISLPEGTKSESATQQDFIDRLLKDAELQTGADLVTGDIEDLKGVMHAALKKMEKPEPPPPERQGNRLIYLICDERDRSATIPLRKFLKGRGCDVQIPLFEGDAATVRQNNQDLLAGCDAVILFYGNGDEAWKRSIESELKKAGAYRAAKPLLASYIYLAEPMTESKTELIELEEPNLINGLQGFSEAEMLKFVTAVDGKERPHEHHRRHRSHQSLPRLTTVPRGGRISFLWPGTPGRCDGRQAGGQAFSGGSRHLGQRQVVAGELRLAAGPAPRRDGQRRFGLADGTVPAGRRSD